VKRGGTFKFKLVVHFHELKLVKLKMQVEVEIERFLPPTPAGGFPLDFELRNRIP
jgi:hypothetical protein